MSTYKKTMNAGRSGPGGWSPKDRKKMRKLVKRRESFPAKLAARQWAADGPDWQQHEDPL
jgi:hypothetical protein